MSYFSVDIEADGDIPPYASMISLGAVLIKPGLTETFYSELKPISPAWNPDALAISGFSREQTLEFQDPEEEMRRFEAWVLETSKGKPIFIADNNGFDFAWVNWYFQYFLGRNPFGWSSRRFSDIYSGFDNDMYTRWKHLRETGHSHNALEDSIGNAEVLLKYQQKGLKIKLD